MMHAAKVIGSAMTIRFFRIDRLDGASALFRSLAHLPNVLLFAVVYADDQRERTDLGN